MQKIQGMAELITDLDQRTLDNETGDDDFANVVGESLADGTWEAWLEFVPLTDAEPLVTGTETHQPSRADLVRWANQLTDVYVEGAFDRAVVASEESRIASRLPAEALDPLLTASAAVDPFDLLSAGKGTLRAALQPLTRAELMAIIDAYNLNPPRHSLARLTDRQLVTFIITDVETIKNTGSDQGSTGGLLSGFTGVRAGSRERNNR